MRGVIDVHQPHEQLIRQLGAGGGVAHDDGQQALAVLAGALGDQLLGPVTEADGLGAGIYQHHLVSQRAGATECRAQAERRVGVVIRPQRGRDCFGLVEQSTDVCAGQTTGDESERGQRRVPATDVGVGVEDGVTGVTGVLVERATGIGDNHDPLRRVDAGVLERLLVDAALRVGLDGGAGFGRHDDDRLLETVRQSSAHHVRLRRVQHRQRHAVGLADHLRCERGATHAAEDDVVEPLVSEFAS